MKTARIRQLGITEMRSIVGGYSLSGSRVAPSGMDRHGPRLAGSRSGATQFKKLVLIPERPTRDAPAPVI